MRPVWGPHPTPTNQENRTYQPPNLIPPSHDAPPPGRLSGSGSFCPIPREVGSLPSLSWWSPLPAGVNLVLKGWTRQPTPGLVLLPVRANLTPTYGSHSCLSRAYRLVGGNLVPNRWPPYLSKFIHAACWDDLAKTWLPYLRTRSPALCWRELGQTLNVGSHPCPVATAGVFE